MSQNRTDKKKAGCTQAYTWEMIYDTVKAQYALKNSLRRIANEDYNGEINHAVIHRILQGREPRDPEIRRALGLDVYAQVEAVNGDIPTGSLSIGAAMCVLCSRWYISNHPRRRKCFICSPYRGAEP